MDERALGLILRTRPLTESSLVIHWLTREFGRISTVAKGARRPKSPFQGKLDLLYLADLSFHRRRQSELHTLREVAVREFNTALRTDLGYLRQAAYFVNCVEQTTETETPIPTLFELFSETLRHLPQQPPRPSAVFVFEMRLLADHGLQPNLAETALSAGAKRVLARLSEADWSTLSRLRLALGQVNEIQRFLHGFLICHLGKIPAGRNDALLAG